MFKELYEPPNTTQEQRKINEREWNNPENWHGWFCPRYSSKLDNRPIVPGKYMCRSNCNLAHPRGRMWHRLGWAAIILFLLIVGIAALIANSRG
jgi:hypothetical protein